MSLMPTDDIQKELKENLFVCDNCNFHLNMPVENRLDHIYGEKKI